MVCYGFLIRLLRVLQKIYGVSIHPKYGGWFALRGVVIFSDTLVPNLPRLLPPDVLPDDASRVEVLERYNFHWRDWSFRDVVPPACKYSEEQKLYFITPPNERAQLMEKIKTEMTRNERIS